MIPEMPPLLDGETLEQYTDRLTGADKTGRSPYNGPGLQRRGRSCCIGWHGECVTDDCECPCHF